ncbi:MAG TPA: nucleoside-diphosphate kinase [Candidatus Gastranaerophilaceae bacterium]|nr:nucleoside-diphosphate kinase [Candidatus Gastranaerophilaceae bacterium]HPT42168.1 nucleoside-diphosphate kinase [Candidatus Gastranaerophilaceae bacterium]
MERTFVAIKPDGVKRGLIGKIISRIEDKGYKIVGLKMLHVTPELAAQHYAEHVGKPFYNGLIKFITSGPIIAMVLQGENVIESARKFMGKTNPDDAEGGSIRGDFSQVMGINTIHGSDSKESAQREINLYFESNELCDNWKTMFELISDEKA